MLEGRVSLSRVSYERVRVEEGGWNGDREREREREERREGKSQS